MHTINYLTEYEKSKIDEAISDLNLLFIQHIKSNQEWPTVDNYSQEYLDAGSKIRNAIVIDNNIPIKYKSYIQQKGYIVYPYNGKHVRIRNKNLKYILIC